MISDVVEFTFTNEGIECYNPEVVWYNKVDYYYEQMEAAENGEDEEEEEDEEDEEDPEAAEWCQEIVQEDTAVDIYDCGGYEAEEQDDEDENNDDENNNAANYEWYTYELYAEEVDDIGAVCTAFNTEEVAQDDDSYVYNGKKEGYTPHTVYNGENAGLFNYEKATDGSNGMSGWGIFGIIVLVAGLVGAGAFVFMKKSSGSSGKKQPLINDNEGTMA